MKTALNAYLSFKDEAREAMEFYKTVFGGSLTFQTFGEGGMPHDPAEADKIMHAELKGDNDITFMASDTPDSMSFTGGERIRLALSGEDEAALKGFFDKLSGDGGTVTLPLAKAPWGDWFGMCNDKYAITWMVNISGNKTAE